MIRAKTRCDRMWPELPVPTPYPKEQMHRIKYTGYGALTLERATFRPDS